MSHHANQDHSHKKDSNFTMASFHLDLTDSNLELISSQLQAFEWYSEGKGVHWNKLKDIVPKLAGMGITAMWIPRKAISLRM
jgi:alpha-amylase